MSGLIDFATGIGVEAVRKKITEVGHEQQVKRRIKDFLNQQQKLDFSVTKDEEIELEKLEKYICSDLKNEIEKRFLGSKHERAIARETIINRAIAFAEAKTSMSRKRTTFIISSVVDILATYYRKRVNKELLFCIGEIEDVIEEQHAGTNKAIADSEKRIISAIKDTEAFSTDRMAQNVSEGKVECVESQLASRIDMISTKHVLYPDYGFRMNTQNELISFPLTKDAERKYPVNYRLKVSDVRFGEKSIEEIDPDLLNKSYRHQTPISFLVKDAVGFLGDKIDPAQGTAHKMVGSNIILHPPVFPKAFPCSVEIDNKTIVPYLLLRTKEVLDDGTTVLSNEEQEGFHFAIVLGLNFNNNKMSISIKPRNPSHKENLLYYCLLRDSSNGKEVILNSLENNTPIIRGLIAAQGIGSIDERIDFLEKIIAIEDHLQIKMTIPDEISVVDYNCINRVYSIISGGYKGSWNEFEFSFNVSDAIRERIAELSDSEYMISYSGEAIFKVFNSEIIVPVVREIYQVRVHELEKVMEKIKVLENGDVIRIKYVPSGDSTGEYIDKLASEGNYKKLCEENINCE